MSKNTMNIAKTVGLGLAAGSAVAMIGTAVMKNNSKKSPMKNMRKSAGKAVHTMGQIVNGVESMLK